MRLNQIKVMLVTGIIQRTLDATVQVTRGVVLELTVLPVLYYRKWLEFVLLCIWMESLAEYKR